MIALVPLLVPSPGGLGDVERVLSEGAREAAPDAARIAAELKRLGPDALPELFAALANGPALGREPSPTEESALIAAIGACPRRVLREHVRERLEAGADTDERRAFLRALAPVATADELALVQGSARAGAESAALADAVESAVASILGRDPGTLRPIRHWILEAPPELERPLVRAIAASGSPLMLATLVELLGYRPSLDRELVPELGALLHDAEKPVSRDVVFALADLLDSDDPGVVREAARALGASEDFEETETLIRLLEHEHAGVRDGARSALEELTGLRLGARPERWRAWYASESSWLRGPGRALRLELGTGSLEQVVAALSELSLHRFRRGELASDVALVLRHEDARARELACLALGRLGSRVALAPLRQALEDRRLSVRSAARDALRALGEEPPSEETTETEE